MEEISEATPNLEHRCQFFDTMEDLLALEEYMRWAYDIGRIAVIDGDVWRQNYYAGLVSSVRLDHSFLMDEYWKLSEAFPQPLRRRWLNDQAFSFPGIAELDSWEAKREPGREWEQLNREGFTECDWFPTLEPHQEHLHGIGPACECAVLREIVLRSHDFEQVSHLRAEDGDHWKSYFVTYKSFKGT